ncbi:MAG: TIR domain-containing protein [Gammaproteobacteria bacterium]|nr:TIR domain-containing protein [Gammaproteobacteria bacterium]
MNRQSRNFEYDVCLSFAGEDRRFVNEVASLAKSAGIRVFYDLYEEADLWGKDLYEHLDEVYKNSAQYCVMFISSYYAKKLWTNHERKSAQERAFKENSDYILPARFDDTVVPGLRDTVGYIDLRGKTPAELVDIIAIKIGPKIRAEYVPPEPNLLYEELGIEDEEEQESVYSTAMHFLHSAKRLSHDERVVVFNIFLHGCPGELPENIHININLLSRITGMKKAKVLRILKDVSCLNFLSAMRVDDENSEYLEKKEMLVFKWCDYSFAETGNATEIVNAMVILAVQCYCEEQVLKALCELNFSHLADATSDDPYEH